MPGSILWAGYPKSYTPGRARPIQFITLHYTAGSEGPNSAEGGVQYDKTRIDGTSAHYYIDSLGPALQEVPDGDRAHTARYHGNEIGVHLEICGTRQSRAQWLDGTSQATLRTTAWLVATLLKRHNLPLKRLSTDETRAAYFNSPGNRPKGINDHNACTLAFPEDDGDHTDVGPEFPWDVFMPMVQQELQGGNVPRLFILTDDDPADKVCITDGVTYRWLTDDLDDVMHKWSLPFPPDSEKYTLAQAAAYFGKDIANLQGPKGDKGDPGEDGLGFVPGQTVTVTGPVTVQ